MRNRNITLRNSLPAICSAIAGQKGVKIIWEGPPKTEGSTIWSNPLPVDADENTVKMVVGDIDHECGHIRFSDFDLVNTKGKTISKLQFSIWNALEDIFEERKMGDEYIGCQQTLAESVEIAIAQGKCRDGKDGPSDALVTYCDAWGRKNVLQQSVDPILVCSHQELVKHIEEKGVARLEALLSTKLYSANSTQETLALSGLVIKLMEDIKDEQEQEQNPEPKEEKDDPTESQDDDGESDVESGKSDDDEQNSDNSNAQGDNSRKGSNSSDPKDSETNQDVDKSEPVRVGSAQDILDDQDVSDSPVVNRRSAAEAMTKESALSGCFVFNPHEYALPHYPNCIARYNSLKSSISASIAQLQRRLAMEFETRTHCRNAISESGRLDSRRVHHAILGDPRIRREKKKMQSVKPAVSLVLDCSTSMRGMKLDIATQAVIALAEVCNTMGVPCEVGTFSATVGPVKPFDTPLTNSRGRIGGIDASGCTPTSEALWIAGNRLFNRKEERKILMLVTDGEADDKSTAKQVANIIERSGIELYGVGIQTNTVRDTCTKSSVVSNTEDLASAILTALAERMLSAA